MPAPPHPLEEQTARLALAALEALLDHLADRQKRVPQLLTVAAVILFALFPARRPEEIVRPRWSDFRAVQSRVPVRDGTNPGEKRGNDVSVDLPEPARPTVERMPRKAVEILPSSADATSADVTQAAKRLGIEDRPVHDLRHEGISRLLQMGRGIPDVAAVSGHRSRIRWQALHASSPCRGSVRGLRMDAEAPSRIASKQPVGLGPPGLGPPAPLRTPRHPVGRRSRQLQASLD